MQSVTVRKQIPELPSILLSVLPRELCDAVLRCGAPRIEEIRLHVGRLATVSCGQQNFYTGIALSGEQMERILNAMCQGSLYAYAHTINQGYLSLPDGIRVGICGSAVMENGRVIGVGEVSGLVLRIPCRVRVSARPILDLLSEMGGLGGVLIYAPPGVGKTTLLRSLAIEASEGNHARRTVVVDTREELACALTGNNLLLDVLVGYPKELGIEIAVRSMGAELVICDEIGSTADASAILRAANCGVPIVASTHAKTARELLRRPAIEKLHRAQVFGAYVGLSRKTGVPLSFEILRRKEMEELVIS